MYSSLWQMPVSLTCLWRQARIKQKLPTPGVLTSTARPAHSGACPFFSGTRKRCVVPGLVHASCAHESEGGLLLGGQHGWDWCVRMVAR